MATYGIIVGTFIVASMVEARCRNGGDPIKTLTARRFGRFFLLGAGMIY